MENLNNKKPTAKYLKELTELIANIKQEHKNKNYTEDVVKALIRYKMADLGIDELEFKLLDKNCGYVGAQQANAVFINERMLKFSLKNLVALIDCLLHEFSHVKTKNANAKIKKDEFGNADGEYIPKFYETCVYSMLHSTCKLDFEDASSYSVALYAYDRNEQKANAEALAECLDILNRSRNETNQKIIDKMIVLENNLFQKFVRKHHTKQNKFLIEQFNYQYKANFLNFQFEFAKKPTNTPLNISKMQVARMLCPSAEADQKLFNYFLQKGNVDACIKIINQPDFKNTPKNLKELIKLMSLKNVDISKLTGIDKNAISRVLSNNAYAPTAEPNTQLTEINTEINV